MSIYGQERIDETLRLCKMNLAVHGLEGQISQSNTYYEDPFKAAGQFDYVMANPPFNVNKVDKAKLEGDKRFPFGLPKADNANYIWIQAFYSSLNDKGRAGFVMANSAADAGGSELEIRKKLIAEKAVDVIVAVGSELLLHRDAAGDAVVPRPRQARHGARGRGAVHRRAQDLPPDRPRPPRLDGRSRSSSWRTSRGSTAARRSRPPKGRRS